MPWGLFHTAQKNFLKKNTSKNIMRLLLESVQERILNIKTRTNVKWIITLHFECEKLWKFIITFKGVARKFFQNPAGHWNRTMIFYGY